MADIEGWLSRLDAVEDRLRALAIPRAGLTEPDPATGEQWEAGQVWGHLAEFIQFWVEQAGDVIDEYTGEPVSFGRSLTDPTRLTGIEQGRVAPVSTLWEEVQADLADFRQFLSVLPDGWDAAVGLHPRRGPVPVERILEDFVVAHLEEHAEQLEGLPRYPGSGSNP